MKYECRDRVDRDVAIDRYLLLRREMQWLKQLAELAMVHFRSSEAEYSRISFNLGAMGCLAADAARPSEEPIEGQFYLIKCQDGMDWEPAQRGRGHWWLTGKSRHEQVFAVGLRILIPEK